MSSSQPHEGSAPDGGGSASDAPTTGHLIGSDSGFPLEEAAALRRAKSALLGLELEAIRIDRYVVLEQIGMGAMGAVYRAYDPELHRQVAIKVLISTGHAEAHDQSTGRLVLEARAIAQLSHPNVVAIYDVGEYVPQKGLPGALGSRSVFIVMEMVEGQSVRQWLDAGPHARAEILRVFSDAGRGLAAAHARGIVHRDFKPANVLIGEDGRVRVADFGLARSVDEGSRNGGGAEGTGVEGPENAGSFAGVSGPLQSPATATATGMVLGTPAYMAPEQHTGGKAGPSADQYAFCVALYEALHGRRPFAGSSIAELARAKVAGVPERGSDAAVPHWLHRILQRGLAKTPSDRWPSVDDLLVELGRDPAIKRRRIGLTAGAVALLGIGAAGAYQTLDHRARLCEVPDGPMAQAWMPARRIALEERFLASGVPHASGTFARVDAGFDRYVQRWNDEHVAACDETRREGNQTERVLELRMACLRRLENQATSLLELLGETDTAVVDKAVSAVAGLPDARHCSDPTYYHADLVPPGDGDQERVDQLRTELDRAKSLTGLKKIDQASEAMVRIAAEADEVGYRPLRAEARYWLGLTQIAGGKRDDAIEEFEEAYFLALGSGHDEVAVQVVTSLVDYKSRAGEAASAQLWARVGQETIRRIGDPPELLARLHYAVGSLHQETGEYAEALAAYEQCIAIREELHGPNDPRTAIAVNAAGRSLSVLGRHEEAEVFFSRALDIWKETHGEEHPLVADGVTNMAITLAQTGQYDQAIPYFEESLAMRTRLLGDEHPEVAAAHLNVGLVLSMAGRHEDALARMERALELASTSLSPNDPSMSKYRASIAGELGSLGRFEDAIARLQPAVLEQVKRLGSENPAVADTRVLLAVNLIKAGRPAEGLQEAEEALRTRSHSLGDENVRVAETRLIVAEALLSLDRIEAAAEVLAKARAVLADEPGSREELARVEDLWKRASRKE